MDFQSYASLNVLPSKAKPSKCTAGGKEKNPYSLYVSFAGIGTDPKANKTGENKKKNDLYVDIATLIQKCVWSNYQL